MFQVLVVVFWLSLIIGTALAQNIVANWAVALAGLYFLARWWSRRTQASRRTRAAPASVNAATPSTEHPAIAAAAPTQPSSRWTVDRVHATEQHWR